MTIKNHPFKKLLIASCLSFSILLFSQCKKDELVNESLNSSEALSIESSPLRSENMLLATSAPSGAYNIQNALPSGYVKDGSRDYTVYIQNAIDKYSEIAFPGFPILVNDAGLRIGSNKRLTFLNGSEIRLKPTSKSSYNILDIRGASNVTLVDPVIIGDKDKHTGTSGEAGVGIGIRGSSNITISNPKVSKCWGDGFYIGVNDGKYNRNITISGGSSSYNRRDGMSIISVDGLRIDNFNASYNVGTSPQCGINFEPNSNSNELKNVVFNNITTQGNPGYGIQMGFSNLYGAGNKYLDVTINNHKDIQSRKAIKLSIYTTRRVGSESIIAKVIYNNPSWKQSAETPRDIIAVAINDAGTHLTLKNPAIQTSSGTSLSETDIITMLSRLIKSTTSTLTFVDEPVSSSTTSTPTSTSTGSVVFAVNAGGSDFTASNGIKYLADRNYSGGKSYSTTSSVSGTSDDALYQKERYGNFSYSVPLSNGTYEVSMRFAETVYSASGKRKFDVVIEGVNQLTSVDLYALAGKNNAYNVVKTVNVTDGKLDLDFNANISYAELKAFHVIKK